MLINNLLLISIEKLCAIWLIMYLLIIGINYFRQNNPYTKEELIKSPTLAKIYLDQFYITNKPYTFFATAIYIFGMVIIFIFLRFASINDIEILLPRDNLYTSFVQITFVYVKVFITLILYRTLLLMLFKKEINKLYLYIRQFFRPYNKFTDILEFKLSHYLISPLYVLTYRIAELTYKEDLYPFDLLGDMYYILSDEYDHTIDNKRVIAWAYDMKDLASKNVIIQKLFWILAYIFEFMLKHINNITRQIPYFIVIMIFLIDLYNKQFHNIYLALFIFILIKTKHNLETFLDSKWGYGSTELSEYFYENQIPYETLRRHFYSNEKLSIEFAWTSKATRTLESNIKEVIEYTFNDFTKEVHKEHKRRQRRERGVYRRFLTIVGSIGIGYFMLGTNLEANIPLIVLLTPIILMMYSHYKTYNGIEVCETAKKPEYSKTYNIIFWIATIIQGYIYWILILKPELIFMQTEILVELPYDILKIIKVYSVEEKIKYLYQYFEYYVQSLPTKDSDYMRYMLRQINFEILIDNKVNLKDIQVYIKLLIDNYICNENFINFYILPMLNEYVLIEDYLLLKESLYLLLRNSILIGSLSLTGIRLYNYFLLVKVIYTQDNRIYQIIHSFSKSIMKYYPMRDDIDLYSLYLQVIKFFGW